LTLSSYRWDKAPPSYLRWQVGEAALAGEHGFELGKLLVAPMVAAFRDVVGRDRLARSTTR
jgi:hypothetical protein